MVNPVADLEPRGAAPRPRRRWRFTLRGLLVITALVAAFLGGRASMIARSAPPRAGAWRLVLPSGYEYDVPLVWLGDQRYHLHCGRLVGGEYVWRGDELVLTRSQYGHPAGLIWTRDGDDFVLVAEPANRRRYMSASALGARLSFLTEKTPASVRVVKRPAQRPARK